MLRQTVFFAICAALLALQAPAWAAEPGAAHAPGSEGPTHMNRLADEQSPYLLKHASNPVDWYPWGDEAFDQARLLDKPIFLSIGYSTCHWCNVMEEESFSDPEVAALMNEAFISIKVDREERPDIDAVYMAVCQMISESCGWPLNVVMTPERRPFLAGTYFPRESRMGRIGMLELVPRLGMFWDKQRSQVLRSADRITDALRQSSALAQGEALDQKALDSAYETLRARFDPEHGGFGTDIKFPMPHNLLFLLRYGLRTGDPAALGMVRLTLGAMRRGGIYDHLGFGFHRYSTDREWRIPHFEKMLYDQALISLAYIEAHQAAHDDSLARTAREIFAYVLRDMTSPEGGFYSAESADSEGEEGRFYLFKEEEIRSALGKDAPLFLTAYGVEPEGNYVDQLTGEKMGRNILHLTSPPAQIKADAGMAMGMDESALLKRLEPLRVRLLAERAKRIRPDRDDKILADWNGLMIAALARGARVLDEPEYARAAIRASDFILKKLRSPDGRLLHRYRGGRTAYRALASDYAFVIWGLIELYETTFDPSYLASAEGLMAEFIAVCGDQEGGGFYLSPADATGRKDALPVRIKETADAAIPSANSVAFLDLLRLSRLTGKPEYEERASRLAQALSGSVEAAPHAHAMFLAAMDLALGPSFEIVVAGDPDAHDTRAILKALRREYVPNAAVVLVPPGPKGDAIRNIAPYTMNMGPLDGKAAIFICKDFACDLPTTDMEKALAKLR